MKSLRSIVPLLLISFGASGQNFLIKENFSGLSDTIPPTGWKNITVSGSNTLDKFFFDSEKYHLAPPVFGQFAIFDAYNGGSSGGTASNNMGEEVILELPPVNTVGLSNLNVSFSKQTFLQNFAAIYLELSIDTGKTWINVWSQANSVVDGTPVTVELALDTFIGHAALLTRYRWHNQSTSDYRGFFVLDNVHIFERYQYDVMPVNLVRMYDQSCPEKRQPIEVEVTNVGTDSAVNVVVHVTSGTYVSADTIPFIGAGKSASLLLPDSLNTSAGGTFEFTIVSTFGSDQVTANDTLTTSRISAIPTAKPEPRDTSRCGTGTALLIANRNLNDSTYWFAQDSGGVDLGSGVPFETPVISTTTTFYCENSRVSQNSITTFAGLYRYNGPAYSPGSMFNVEAKHDVIIDSIGQHFAYAGNFHVKVYVKSGTYRGSETNILAWTQLDLERDTIAVAGYGQFYTVRLKKPLRIPAGQTMGFYVDADSVTFSNGSVDRENSDLRLEGNTVLSRDFAGVLNNFYWNGDLFYRKTCSGERVPVEVTVLPTPTGAVISRGVTFEGVFRVGSLRDPDIVAEKKKLEYIIQPPSGYTNSDYGSAWTISEISLLSKGGVSVPSSDTSITWPGKDNGMLSLVTPDGWADSLILMQVVIREAKNNCDSTLMRYIYIAPTPVPVIDFRNVCDGEAVSYDNYSYILVGFLTYHWDFGDGNQATSAEPIYTYDTFGTYTVTLTVTSDNGISADTTFTVTVYEIPDVDFTVESSCDGVPANFINETVIGSGTLSYIWDFGDGNTTTLKDPTHQYLVPGSYEVTLDAYANGCTNRKKKNANLFARPTADFKVEGACSGTPIRFTNTSTINSTDAIGSFWRFGDGTVGTLKDIVHIYTRGDIYEVEMVAVTQFGCRDSITKDITILPGPLADFSFTKGCENLPVEFKNNTYLPLGMKVIYHWEFGDGDSSTQFNPTHLYDVIGEKEVTLTAGSENGCATSITKELKVSAQPKASFMVSDGCTGKPVQFINTTRYSEGSISYKWYFGDQDSSDFTSPTHIYTVNSTSTFTVTLIADIDGGCIDDENMAVTIEEAPECGFTAYRSDSIRTLWTFVPDNEMYDPSNYTWIFEGSGVVNGEVNPTHRFEYPDHQYRVILRVKTENGCECADSNTTITTSWGLGVRERNGTEPLIYPNPASEELTIDLRGTEAMGNVSLMLLDYSGRLVWSAGEDEIDAGGIKRVPLHGLAAGVYMLVICSDNNHVVSRVIIDAD